MKPINNFILVLKMNTRQAWFHRGSANAQILSWAIRMGMTIVLYYFVYKTYNIGSVNGITFQIATSSMILYALFVGTGYRNLFSIINRDVKSGAIEVWVNKPVSYIHVKVAETFGKNLPVFFGLLVAGFVFWFVSGQLPVVENMPLRLLAAVPIAILGLVIATLLYVIIGLSAVWLTEAKPIYTIVDKFIMIFGGAYIPIGFFPPALRLVGELFPTGAAIYITQLFYTNFLDNFPRFIAVQIFWLVVLSTGVYFMSKSVNQNLTINGG